MEPPDIVTIAATKSLAAALRDDGELTESGSVLESARPSDG